MKILLFLGGRSPPKPSRGRAMFTSVIHAAAPHDTRMKMFVLGRAQPSQTLPPGRGLGKPGFPISQPVVGAAGAPPGRGLGKPGFPVCSPPTVPLLAPSPRQQRQEHCQAHQAERRRSDHHGNDKARTGLELDGGDRRVHGGGHPREHNAHGQPHLLKTQH